MIVWSGILFSSDFLSSDLPPVRLSPSSYSTIYENSAICENSAVGGSSVPNIPVRNVNIQTENWTWQLYPDGFIYPTYLAAVQHRLGGVWNYDKDLDWMWDITLGGRAPLYRYGTKSSLFPEGWQLDLEGSVHLRLHLIEAMDMEANDFRFGLPLSYGTKIWQVRTGYYHVSCHMGDRRMMRYYAIDPVRGDPAVPPGPYPGLGTRTGSNYRLSYYREAWLLSYAIRPPPNTRLYAEVDYAFMRGEPTSPWHFQFGAEYSPLYPARGGWGTPFAAVNARLMQEHNFDGNITVQTGWQWRGSHNQLFRVGVQYFAGISEQYEFLLGPREHKIGIGAWYDF
jgi:hypothetical protein